MKVRSISDAGLYVSAEAVRRKVTRSVDPGAVLCVTRSGILANTFPVAITARTVAFNQDIRALVPRARTLYPQYLLALLQWAGPFVIARGVKKGPTVHSLRKGFLENLIVPVPPFDLQVDIANSLERQQQAVTEVIDVLTQQHESVSGLSPAALREIVSDPRVVNAPTRLLGELSTLINGDAYRESDWAPSGTPIIRIQNLNDATKPFNYWPGSLDNRVTVKSGDVLLAWSGTPGTSFGAHRWNRGLGVLNQHIFRVDLTREVDPDWAVLQINLQLRNLIQSAQGAVGLRHITKRQTESLPIQVPPLNVQRALVLAHSRIRNDAQHAQSLLDSQLTDARMLLKALLREAFPFEYRNLEVRSQAAQLSLEQSLVG